MTRSQRRTQLTYLGKATLRTYLTAKGYRNIDGTRPNFADLAGLDREDLIDLILKAEYPDTGPRTEVTAITDPPPKSPWPPPDTHTEG